MADRYRVDDDRIVSEVIEGEAIVINLANGHYYSFNGTAAEVWAALRAGQPVAAIAGSLRRRYDCAGADPDRALGEFLAALETEDLATADAGSAGGVAPGGPPLEPAGPEARPAFRPPAFERYTDMEGFLLVDPIHEVDGTGWPPRPGAPPQA